MQFLNFAILFSHIHNGTQHQYIINLNGIIKILEENEAQQSFDDNWLVLFS